MSSVAHPILNCHNVRVHVPGRLLVEALDLAVHRGEFIAVLGQNGAGKTLTLMTLAGLRAADSGTISLYEKNLLRSPRAEIARQLALLPQDVEDIFPATVIDTVLIGRHPHIGRWHWESPADFSIAIAALQTMGLSELRQRDVLTLSGGERRRLAIAQVLTQQPDLFLLDEPTNHLDPQHQLDAMRVFRQAADDGAGVVATLHDVNLAVRFADKCLLLFGDGRWEFGPSDDVLTEDRLSELFATRMEAITWRSHHLFVAAADAQSIELI